MKTRMFSLGLILAIGSLAPGQTIEVDSVLLSIIEQAEVPAQEAGVLKSVAVREGELVKQGEQLAQIEDTDANLKKTRAQIELDNARRNAENDIQIRVASKAAEVAAAELRRALDARETYTKSVSVSEIDRLRLAADHAKLQVEQAEFELQTAQLALQVNENELRQAERQVERRRILAPIDGRVVQIYRRPGEWVEPGQAVLRVLRVDRLKAVGFLDASQAVTDLVGRPVTLQIALAADRIEQFPGVVTFVNPEVNPVNGQLDFWAEVENRDLLLRPGQRGSLTIGLSETPQTAAN